MADPKPNPPKEMSMEIRLLLAMILMGAVLYFTQTFYKPATPPTTTPAKKEEPKAAPVQTPPPPAPLATKGGEPPPKAAAGVAATKEENPVVETDLYRIEFTNRGALIKNWTLKQYTDSDGKPLNLVNSAGAQKVGHPFSIQIKGRDGWAPVNDALFAATTVPGGVDFEFSDGRVYCKKTFRTKPGSYLVQVSSEVLEAGVAIPHLLVWRGGFGDSTVPNAAPARHSIVYDIAENKLVVNNQDYAKDGPQSRSGNFAFAGLEDAYFAIVTLPQGTGATEIYTINDMIPGPEGKEEAVVGGAIGGEGRNRLTLFVGPKDYNLLKSIDPRLDGLISFGWTSFIAKPLFLALKWVNTNWTKNWGWSIILVTVIINILLLPLKITSLKSMRKMSLVAPEMQAINEKYKGLSMKDPKMQNKNQEVMELYKKHGVNPAGGCVPLLLQFPFLFAFYAVLSIAIELRHAGWAWVADLSQPEQIAIRILPLLMIASQFWIQKMTPATGGDPAQQKMMMFMPLVFGFMFYGSPSGLVLYWLTGNLVGVIQQWVFNKTMPAPAAAPVKVNTNQSKKKGGR